MIANTPTAWDERAQAPSAWQAALWSERGQTQRFLAVLRALELQPGERLLDYGCGIGRFCEFLPEGVHYQGFDWSEEMMKRARTQYPHGSFIPLYPTAGFDHIVCIGTFNLADNWSREQTWGKLEELWKMARSTLVVSLYRGEDPDSLRYDPVSAAVFAETLGCTRCTIETGYLPNDLLLVLRR